MVYHQLGPKSTRPQGKPNPSPNPNPNSDPRHNPYPDRLTLTLMTTPILALGNEFTWGLIDLGPRYKMTWDDLTLRYIT